jgi:hypothetical protein
MINKYMKAILSLNSNAKCSYPVSFDAEMNATEDLDNITWEEGTTPISKEDIIAEATRLENVAIQEATDKENKKASAKQKLQDLGLTVMALSTIPFSGLGADASNQGVNFRNLIINGDMSIAQRGTTQTGMTSSQYPYAPDRFHYNLSSAGTWTVSQSTDVPSGQGFGYSEKFQCTTANGSLSAGSFAIMRQIIEAQMVQHLKYGTSNAESITLSFWVKSNKTGTYSVWLYQDDDGRSIANTYTISSADTWEKKTITYSPDTTGVIDNDNGNGLRVNFYLVAGTNFTSGTLATSWESDTATNRAVGQVNLADSTSNYINFTGIQLEVGTSASDFEFLPYDVNLQKVSEIF